jgi:hypothetical protein
MRHDCERDRVSVNRKEADHLEKEQMEFKINIF